MNESLSRTHTAPLLRICALWVANGAVQIQRRLSHYEPLKKLFSIGDKEIGTIAAVIVLLGFMTISFMPEFGRILARKPYSKEYWTAPVEQKAAGLWLKENDPGHKIIMSRYQTVDIYAGNYNIRESITIPDNDLDRVLAYARNRGVNYIVLNERYKEDNPRITHLFDMDDDADGLERIYANRDPSGYLTMIYRVN